MVGSTGRGHWLNIGLEIEKRMNRSMSIRA